MHLQIVTIENFRVFKQLRWQAPVSGRPGWHVVIGDNGSGKSTFVRAIALSLVGPKDAAALRENWDTWVRGDELAKVRLAVAKSDDWDEWAGVGPKLKNFYPTCGVNIARNQDGETLLSPGKFANSPLRTLWSRKPGWFAASYGPFRRFTGGDPDQRKYFYSHPFLARHLSVFNENVALSEALEWLTQLRFEQLEDNKKSEQLLDWIRLFLNQHDFLPHGVRFESVNSKSVIFRSPEGVPIDVARLSDGFRSVLSMTFELIRQMVACYETTNIFQKEDNGLITVKAPGVVLVDEIDVHLHPTWQQRIGYWLTRHFPQVQFIVTTHSPLVCQAAENGSIFRLPAPGSRDEEAGFVTGTDRERLLRGDVLDAYGTELFGKNVDRSDLPFATSSRTNERAC